MSIYEFALVLREEAGKSEAELKKIAAEIVSKVKGKITSINSLGLKQLSYPVKKALKGWVMFMEIEAEGSEMKSLDRNLKINDQVLRNLIIKKE